MEYDKFSIGICFIYTFNLIVYGILYNYFSPWYYLISTSLITLCFCGATIWYAGPAGGVE